MYDIMVSIPVQYEQVIVVEHQMSNFSAISLPEQNTFNEMMMMSALYQTNTPNWIFILSHCNNSPWVYMSLHSDFEPICLCSYSLKLRA